MTSGPDENKPPNPDTLRGEDDFLSSALKDVDVSLPGGSGKAVQASSNLSLVPGDLLAKRFRILRFVAQGGMGEVYEAEDLELDETVAIKTLRPEIAANPEFVARFKREIQLARKVGHPNVCRMFDLFQHEGKGGGAAAVDRPVTFLTMQFLKGETLATSLRRKGRFEPAELLPIARQMAEGLAAAHQAGIIHQDFKTSNVMMVATGEEGAVRAIVTDFGLAQSVQGKLESSVEGRGGTPDYMAPEQVPDAPYRGITARTDVFAFGVVLYELATGRLPYPASGPREAMRKRVEEAPLPPSKFAPELSASWERVILRCLERDPAKRYADAIDTVRELEGADEQKKALPAARWKAYAVGILGVLAISVVAGIWINRSRQQPQGRAARPKLAVLGFKNVGNNAETDWISTPLSELLTSELEAGEHLVTTPGESVARAKRDLALAGESSYAEDTVRRVHQLLHCDYFVYGAYFAPGKAGGQTVRVDLRLQDANTGATIQTATEQGTESDLPGLASRLGARLRAKFEVPGISTSESQELQAAMPSTPEATKAYYEGLERLRNLDFLGARQKLEKAVLSDPSFALAHASLAEAWFGLGYDDRSRDESEKAFDLSKHLSREDQRMVEARFREMSSQWDQAVALYQSLWSFYPEKPEYALSAADVLVRAGRGNDALKIIQTLRNQNDPVAKDPRLDLKEGEAHASLAEWAKDRDAAERAANFARERGARLLQAEALWRACEARFNLGDSTGAAPLCQQSVEIAQPLNDLKLVARGLTILGEISESQGNLERALESHRLALEHAKKIGSRRDVAGALINIGRVLGTQGSHAEAEKSYQQGLDEAREVNDQGQIQMALNNLAIEEQGVGNFAAALNRYQQSLEMARAIQDKQGIAMGLGNMGSIYSLQGNFAEALKNIQEAIRIAQENGLKSDEIQYLYLFGDAKLSQGDLAAAESNYQSGKALATEIGEKASIAQSGVSLGSLRLLQGKSEEALPLAEAAVAEFKAEGMKDQESQARNLLASCLLEFTRVSEAAKELDLIKVLAPRDPTIRLPVAIAAARIEVRTGKGNEAKKGLERVVLEAKRMGIPGVQFEARLAEAEWGRFGGDKRWALSVLEALAQEASRKGYRLFESRAKEAIQQIATSKSGANSLVDGASEKKVELARR